jgi:hypothetical protein
MFWEEPIVFLIINYFLDFEQKNKNKTNKTPSYIPGYNLSRCHVFRWSRAKNGAPLRHLCTCFFWSSQEGEIGDRWLAGQSDSDRWMRTKEETIPRTTDHWTFTPPAPPPPWKLRNNVPSVRSSVRWRSSEILLPISEDKNKFVECDLIRIWWRKVGRKNLYLLKNCTFWGF